MKRSSVIVTAIVFSFLVLFSVHILKNLQHPRVLAGTTNFQPSAPYYITFFYPWYQNPNTDAQWSQWSDPPNGSTTPHTPPQNWFSQYLPDPNPNVFDPTTELYSSSNDQILYWQLRKLAEAKQEVAIASWWGQTHKTNAAFSHIIKDVMNRPDNPYPNLRWAIYYEKEGFGDPAVATELVPDLEYIISNYTNEPAYFKINGRPVVFVYNAAHTGYNPLNDLSRWQQAKAKVLADTGIDLYVVMKRDPLTSGASPTAIDGWHEYAPAARTSTMSNYWFSVSPGFWLNGQAARLPRDPAAFETGVQQMVAANTTWKITETWNEWGEGSGVEPADEVNQVTSGTATIKTGSVPFKNTYIDILNRDLPPLEAGTGASVGGTNVSPTQPPSLNDPVIAAAGDIACGAGSTGAACKQQATADIINAMNPQAVLDLGDDQYEQGALSDFMNYYDKSWGKFKAKTKPAVGNHEYLTTGAKGYFDYFNGVNVRTGLAGDRTKGYYSYDIGAWHLIALNSNCSQVGGCGAGSPQETWLRQDLQAHPVSCTLAYFHHPRYTSGQEPFNSGVLPLYQALYDNHADVVLVGHDHDYERFAPQDNTAKLDTVNGIVEFVVGTGGRNFTKKVTSPPNSIVFNNTTFGVLKMTLHPTSYTYQFIPIAGSTFTDSGTNQCNHITAAPTPIPQPTNVLTQPAPSTTAATNFALSIFLHGIGKGGDNVGPSVSSTSPLHTQRNVTVTLYDSAGQQLMSKTAFITYNPTSGNFQESPSLGNVASGFYTVKIAVPNYLQKTIPSIINVTAGQTVQLPSVSLTTGDANNDNMLSILDYNIILDCFSDLGPPKNCADAAKKQSADLTDDGSVNQFDYNLFLRELSVQNGQ